MYLEFYGLRKQPFHVTPDPEFLYLSPSHKEALGALMYGVEQRKGFIAITGSAGVGKTTILRSYLRKAEKEHLKVVYVLSSRLTFEALVKTVHKELGVSTGGHDLTEMVNRLYDVLIEEYNQGNTVLLIIDDAQNLPIDTLESLRMVSNLETSKEKLIQIVLAGPTELEEKLNDNRLSQLKQRLAVRSKILPLTRSESLEYIKLRLRIAGCYNPTSVFSSSAMRAVAKSAGGVPRVLNVLCDNALVTGLGHHQVPINRKTAKEVIRDSDGSTRAPARRWLMYAAAVVAVSGIIIAFPMKETVLKRLWLTVPEDRRAPDRLGPPEAKVGEKIPQPQSSAARADEDRSPAKNGTKTVSTVTKRVTRGTSLSKLSKEIYGAYDARIMKEVLKDNPQIVNPDVIQEGSLIRFPDLGRQ